MKNLWLIFLSLITIACAKTPAQKSVIQEVKQPSNLVLKDTTLNPLSVILLIEGSQAKALGDFEKALQLYQRAIETDINNDAAYFEIASIYQSQQLLNIEQALENIEKAALIDPTNLLYQEVLGQLYIDNQQYEKGINVFSNLTVKDPKFINYQLALANAYKEAKSYSKALEIYNSIENTYGFNPEINYERHLLYFSMGEQEKAIEEIKEIVDSNPQYVSYTLFIAEHYLKNRDLTLALEYAVNVLNQEPNNAAAFAIYLQSLAELDKKNEFIEGLKQVTNSDINVDDKIRLFYPLIELQSAKPDWKSNIHAAANELTRMHNSSAETFALYGDLLYNAGDYDSAIPVYKQSIALRDDVYAVWDQIINHYIYESDYESLASFAEGAINKFPDMPFPAYITGYAHFVNQNYPKAKSILKTAAEKTYIDKSYNIEILSLLADAYHKTKEYEKAYITYDKVLLKEPDNKNVLNNYSYYLAERKINLNKAEKMSARAVALNPDDGNALDTYGWVLYQSGKYKEALHYLEKAVLKIQDSAEVLEHYGDALYKSGDTEKAIYQWQKALSLNQNNKLLQEKISSSGSTLQ